jgi:hypothetical protein
VRDTFGHLGNFARLPLALRRFLAEPLDPERARAIVRERLERRPEALLRLLAESVWSRPASPYRRLLVHAGLAPGDVAKLVRDRGVDGALGELRAVGVYVDYPELKGRRPILRPGLELTVAPRDFDNPSARHDLTLTTGGSTGLANVVYQDLDHIAELAIDELVALAAHGLLDAPTLHWSHILPGSGVRFLLQRLRHGQREQRWWTPIGWRDSRAWPKYAAATLWTLGWLRVWGVRVAPPRTVPPAEAATIARAIRATLEDAGRCLVYCAVSQAVRAATAAAELGLALDGAVFRLASEPLTAAKRARIEAPGARALAGYGSIETGAIALGCAQPEAVDEVHLIADAFALVTHPYEVPGTGVTVDAFHLTGLRPSAPKVLLNYRADDHGLVVERACGCPLGELGWTPHLHSIRSHSKLVGEGVTLLGNDLLPILERALPERFGGGPLDYQLVEREDLAGLTRLVLRVSPRLAIADDSAVVPYFLDRLRAGSPMGDAAGSVWRTASTLVLERTEPTTTARGKQPQLALERREPQARR